MTLSSLGFIPQSRAANQCRKAAVILRILTDRKGLGLLVPFIHPRLCWVYGQCSVLWRERAWYQKPVYLTAPRRQEEEASVFGLCWPVLSPGRMNPGGTLASPGAYGCYATMLVQSCL